MSEHGHEFDALDGERFAELFRRGDPSVLHWLSGRCERVAARQFSAWAWRWIREDFVADLTGQIAGAARQPDFRITGPASPYVDTAIRNLCRRYFRDVARMRSQVPIDAARDEPAPVPDSLVQVAAMVDLKRVFDGLPAPCRGLIEAHYLASRSLRDIGDELGIHEKTARSRLHACREKLRELWRSASTRGRVRALGQVES